MPKIVWTGERLAEASAMWNRGAPTAELAARFDSSEDAINSLASYRRDLFPRRKTHFRRSAATIRPVALKEEPKVAPVYPDRVTRETVSGALITLPRVVFIDGPYMEAAQ